MHSTITRRHAILGAGLASTALAMPALAQRTKVLRLGSPQPES